MSSFKNNREERLIYQDPNLSIFHYPSQKAIFIKLSGYLEEADSGTFFKNTLEAIDQTGAPFLIGDFRDYKGSNLNLAKYANQVWIPKLVGKGITHAAISLPKSEFGAFTIKIATGQAVSNVTCKQNFKEPGEAFTWLQEIAH